MKETIETNPHRIPSDVTVLGIRIEGQKLAIPMVTRLAVFAFVALLIPEAHAQQRGSFDRDELARVEGFIGLPESELSRQFGAPHEVGSNDTKDAVVWTYIIRTPNDAGGASTLAGYRQFAFWNGLVASVSTKWFSDEEHVTHIYESALDYMGDDHRTIARGGGFDREIFTDSLRISRREDNLWMADMLRDRQDSQATLLVGDAGYHMCQNAMELEAKRIESKFGVDVREFADTTRGVGPRNKAMKTDRR